MVTEIQGSDIELIVYGWLTKRGIFFSFQSSHAGGIYELGGAVVDFTLDELDIALRVHGEYWHRQVAKRGQDIIQREMLEAEGWTVVDLWESDIKDNLEETMEKALQGIEML